MSTVQVRDVPSDVHRTLKARAAESGRSLSEYVLDILTRETRQPTIDELLKRARLRGQVDLGDSVTKILRAERDSTR
ncbi:MAG: hypothetical protein QM713_05845 [Arachnia sp.]